MLGGVRKSNRTSRTVSNVGKKISNGKIWGDTRDTTHQTRIDIGFTNNSNTWKEAPALFTEHTLQILGHPVMEDWETPYMERLAQIACSNGGTVLEVGFGMGISARFIHASKKLKRHIIIEMNSEVASRAREFGKTAPRPVLVLEGMWQEVLHWIPDNSLDGILFDTYPLSEPEIHKNHFFFFKSAHTKLKPRGVLTYYSDEIDSYHPKHVQKLTKAGFKQAHIKSEVVPVQPPHNCEYWKSTTILAPIVRKA